MDNNWIHALVDLENKEHWRIRKKVRKRESKGWRQWLRNLGLREDADMIAYRAAVQNSRISHVLARMGGY